MNLRSTGNSGEKNRKWPRLVILATTAALLLSAISFIGVGGAIPQPQQAFAQVEDEDEEPMNATNATNATNGTTTSATEGGGAGGEEDDENDDN
jgi:hypothetical protein